MAPDNSVIKEFQCYGLTSNGCIFELLAFSLLYADVKHAWQKLTVTHQSNRLVHGLFLAQLLSCKLKLSLCDHPLSSVWLSGPPTVCPYLPPAQPLKWADKSIWF